MEKPVAIGVICTDLSEGERVAESFELPERWGMNEWIHAEFSALFFPILLFSFPAIIQV
jgi:hypothetical protein